MLGVVTCITVGPSSVGRDLLIVLIVHIVTEFVTHLSCLSVYSAVGNFPLDRIIYALDCTIFSVRCVGVSPLICNSRVTVEDTLQTLLAVTILLLLNAGERNCFPAGLLLTTLEGVDEGELTALTEAIPVVNVSQPVHQIQTALVVLTTIYACELVEDGVLSSLASLTCPSVGALIGSIILTAVLSAYAGGLPEVILYIRDHNFHCLPCLLQIVSRSAGELLAGILNDVVVHCCYPYQVGHSLGSSLVTVVRSLDDQFLS